MKPDRDDAVVIVQLAQWSTQLDLSRLLSGLQNRDARAEHLNSWTAAQVCEYFDMVGLLHRHGLVNEELLFEWLGVSPVWDDMKEYVSCQRRARSAPALWRNFEALAVAHKRMTREYST